MARTIFFALRLNPSITISSIDYSKRKIFFIFREISIIITATNQTFNTENSIIWIGNCLPFCRLANEALVIGKCHY